MKLIMENWRKYQNEMRDRYLAPGEDPMDASIEDEELHMHISDKTGEIIDNKNWDVINASQGNYLGSAKFQSSQSKPGFRMK